MDVAQIIQLNNHGDLAIPHDLRTPSEWHHMEVSINGGSQKWMVFVRENPMNIDYLGVP